ncbi:MAG: hypothetical protein BRD57_02185 [Proteobacteria bacterium SW_6_67_9]|nr:MAG: hypothetical protein BRD57_02185 [Proteobacteria bacterium SW_6_67_9]
MALRIQSLLQRLPELPARDARASADAASDEPASGLAGWWQRLRDRLSQYVVVRRQGEGEPGTRPQREAALAAAEKLGYALSEARRAALRREPAPYKAALERAGSLLDDGFAAESPTVAHFRERIETLAQRSVTTDYPDLTKTLDRVERVTAELASRRQRPDFVDSSEED